MQFSDTSTKQGLIQDIDFLLFGSSASLNSIYSMADRTRNINLAYDEIITELFNADPNFQWDDTNNVNFPIATTNLLSGYDHYTFPDSSLVVHEVRMKDSNGVMKRLVPKLRRELSDSQLISTGSPDFFYKIDNAIFPVPIPNYAATAGVEIQIQRGGNYFTVASTTAEPGFNPQFHQFLSVSAALRYAIANGMDKKIRDLERSKDAIRKAVSAHYKMRSPDERPKLRLAQKQISSYGLN